MTAIVIVENEATTVHKCDLTATPPTSTPITIPTGILNAIWLGTQIRTDPSVATDGLGTWVIGNAFGSIGVSVDDGDTWTKVDVVEPVVWPDGFEDEQATDWHINAATVAWVGDRFVAAGVTPDVSVCAPHQSYESAIFRGGMYASAGPGYGSLGSVLFESTDGLVWTHTQYSDGLWTTLASQRVPGHFFYEARNGTYFGLGLTREVFNTEFRVAYYGLSRNSSWPPSEWDTASVTIDTGQPHIPETNDRLTDAPFGYNGIYLLSYRNRYLCDATADSEVVADPISVPVADVFTSYHYASEPDGIFWMFDRWCYYSTHGYSTDRSLWWSFSYDNGITWTTPGEVTPDPLVSDLYFPQTYINRPHGNDTQFGYIFGQHRNSDISPYLGRTSTLFRYDLAVDDYTWDEFQEFPTATGNVIAMGLDTVTMDNMVAGSSVVAFNPTSSLSSGDKALVAATDNPVISFGTTGLLVFENLAGTATIELAQTPLSLKVPSSPVNGLSSVHVIERQTRNKNYRWVFVRDEAEFFSLEDLSGNAASVLVTTSQAPMASDEAELGTAVGNYTGANITVNSKAMMGAHVNYVPNENVPVRRIHPVMPTPVPDELGNP